MYTYFIRFVKHLKRGSTLNIGAPHILNSLHSSHHFWGMVCGQEDNKQEELIHRLSFKYLLNIYRSNVIGSDVACFMLIYHVFTKLLPGLMFALH